MKKFMPNLENYFDFPNPGLHAFLDGTERGQPDTYRPPLFKGLDPQAIVADWSKVVSEASSKGELFPGLFEDEMEQSEKIGPYSIMYPFSERQNDVENYYTLSDESKVTIDQDRVNAALKVQKSRYPKGGLRPMSVRSTVEDMKLNTNSGAPKFSRRSKVVDETIAQAEEVVAEPSRILKYLDAMVAILGWRGQPIKKQRVVWMFPFLTNILELLFYKPLIAWWQTTKHNPALISLRAVEEKVTQIFDTKDPEDVVICTDFSKFDQHVNPTMQFYVFEMMKYSFNRISHTLLERVFPIKYNIPIVCTDDIAYEGPHGMGSGSGGTNPDENLVHEGLQIDCAIQHDQIDTLQAMCLGDDGFLTYRGIKLEHVMQCYTDWGQTMNESKQMVSKQSAKYLQRLYHVEYRDEMGIMLGVYSTFRALGRLLYQERFYDPDKWNAKMVVMRTWSILENTKNHPLFTKFVDFVLKGDKFKLGLDLPGFFDEADGLYEEFMDVAGSDASYTRQLDAKGSETGVRDWEVYKYLKSKI